MKVDRQVASDLRQRLGHYRELDLTNRPAVVADDLAIAYRLLDDLVKEADQLREVADALSGEEVTAAIVPAIRHLRDSLKAANMPKVVENLIEGMATVTVYAVANSRWAGLEHRRAERFKEGLQRIEEFARSNAPPPDVAVGPRIENPDPEPWLSFASMATEALRDDVS